MSEQWRPVLGLEDLYEVSNRGRIKALPRERRAKGGTTAWLPMRIMRQHRIGRAEGYWATYLTPRSGPRVRKFAHVLVLEAFKESRPDGMHACHNDGDTNNNTVENLRWDTPSGNMLDRVRHGTHPHAKKDLCSKGHPFDRIEKHPDGSFKQRHCSACKRANKNALRARNRSMYCSCGRLFDGVKHMQDGSTRHYCTACVHKTLAEARAKRYADRPQKQP